MTQDTLRSLADETDGRAIVNRNDLGPGLAQIVRDSSFLLSSRVQLGEGAKGR